ncbi:splicing factor 3A subunit 1-like [Chironomus tepperi]|uniref:splicing factor 3A subunit 1-like n=1 Tax=Chironomus tepperi TaxID=113505 RepID=UPI00391F6D8A
MPVIASRESDQISSDGIGLIIPPPELRNIVDKTASFVARNGKVFETKILEKEERNKKFNFLKSEDVYNRYYLKKIKDFSENKSLLTSQEIVKKQKEILKKLTAEEFKPDKPPKKFEFIADPPSLSPLDLNIVKLTAQFVARNGKQFLTDLMNREQKNPEFDFLRPQHLLFPYFARMIEQYTKILIPPKGIIKSLKAELTKDGIENILKDIKYRAKYIQHEEKQAQIELDKVEKEREAYNIIDWHDFVVVEEVIYEPGEKGDFPKPTTPETLGFRLITELRNEENELTNDVEMEIEVEDEIETKNESIEAKISDFLEKDKETPINISDFSSENVTIKKYDPKSIKKAFVATNKDEYVISPLTGEKILSSKLSEHMRIGLLDPRWIEQRDKHLERTKEQSVYGSGDTVIDNLKNLAERRTDIFGEGDKETIIGKKIGEEEKKEKPVIWDGHMISVESTTRAINKNLQLNNTAQQNPIMTPSQLMPPPKTVMMPNHPRPQKSLHHNEFKVPLPPPPQRHPIHPMNIRNRQPLPVPPPLMMMSPMNHQPRYPVPPVPFFGAPLPPLHPMNMMCEPMNTPEDEQPAKKACPENKLIPEEEFIKMHKSPINIQVQVPTVEKSEWKLNGQKLSIDINLTDTIASLKLKIQEQTEMPPTKQKISFNGTFLKDNFTVAYYNIPTNSTVNLQVKERGGRKK